MNINDITDEELCMFEQLTYLNENVTKIAGIGEQYRISAKYQAK